MVELPGMGNVCFVREHFVLQTYPDGLCRLQLVSLVLNQQDVQLPHLLLLFCRNRCSACPREISMDKVL